MAEKKQNSKPAATKATKKPKQSVPKSSKKTAKQPVKKRRGGSSTDSYGLYVPFKDIANTSDLNLNKQFEYATVSRVGKVQQSNFGL